MKTIDIYSKGEYPADVLSNFYPNAFLFDGVQCASMEGFLQSLKFRKRSKQLKICGLSGKTAKKAGSRKFLWKITGNLYWNGRRYKRDSKEFDDLRVEAYKALAENPYFRKAVFDSKDAALTHSLGKHSKKHTVLTEEEFIGFLGILRRELNL